MTYTDFSERQRNILSVYYRASDYEQMVGIDYYKNCWILVQRLSARYSYSVETVAGLLSILSQEKPIAEGFILAEGLLKNHSDGNTTDCPSIFLRIMDGSKPTEVIDSFTSLSLYYLYNNPYCDAVYIGRRELSVAMYRQVKHNTYLSYTNTLEKYDSFTRDYAIVSEHLDIKASQLQAISALTWDRLRLD